MNDPHDLSRDPGPPQPVDGPRAAVVQRRGRAAAALARLPGHAGAFLFATLLIAVYVYLHRAVTFRGDAYEIWNVATHYFDPEPRHSFVEYRGPFIFVFFNALQRLSGLVGIDPVTGFRVFTSLLFACISTVLLPGLASRLLGIPIGGVRRALLAATLLFFFGGYFLHPQVDFLAFAFFLAALCLATTPGSGWRSYALAAAASVLVVCACLTRFNYIVAFPVMALLLARQAGGDGGRRRAVLRALLFAVAPALLLASTVVAPQPTPQGKVLRMQLTVGMKVQRIEWNAGDERFPGGIEMPDRAGQAVLDVLAQRHPPAPGKAFWMTPGTYVAASAEFPLTFARMWLKHAFNGIDLWYDAVYVQDLYRGRLLRSLLNYLLLFAAGVVVAGRLPAWRDARFQPALILAAAALPALSAIPFVIEVRFFIPIIATAHALAVCGMQRLPVARLTRLLVLLLVVMALCLMLSLRTAATAGLGAFDTRAAPASAAG